MKSFCNKCNIQLTFDEFEFSKGKYCWEHAARAYKWAMISAFKERDEIKDQLQVAKNLNRVTCLV
jgi:hypothetical protein